MAINKSLITKIRVKTGKDTFDEKEIGALADNILIQQEPTLNLTDKLNTVDNQISEINDTVEAINELSSEIPNINNTLGQIENDILSRLMVENSDEGNTSLITQVSFAELIVINCMLNNTINIPNIIIPFEGTTRSYLNYFSYIENEIKYDIYYTITIQVNALYFIIEVVTDKVIKTDLSESPIIPTELSTIDDEHKITLESFKVLKIGQKDFNNE